MRKSLQGQPEVFLSTREISMAVTRGVNEGIIRQLAPRLYTSNLTEDPARLVRRRLWEIIGLFMPGALVSDRTVLEGKPTENGTVFVVADRARDLELPGHRIRTRKGPGPVKGDRPYIGGLYMCSTARAYLDDLAPSRRGRDEVARTLSRVQIEERLDNMVHQRGADALNSLRDEAREIAPLIGRDAEFQILDRLIGALLGTRQDSMVSSSAQARSSGMAIDPRRIELFEKLYSELRTKPPITRPMAARDDVGNATLCFYEAYFSNFIEGTEFEIEEAIDIVFNGIIPDDRPEDAHDVLGTWQLVSNPAEMRRTPKDAAELITLLRQRHATLMAMRPDKRPGEFKRKANRAGDTVFVAPEEVVGTLTKGFELYQSLETAFDRALFMKFMIAEVHPFVDGNGRIARVMMNAELVAAGEERIMIPIVYRPDYLGGLKALSHNSHPVPLVRTLDYAQKWVGLVPWGDLGPTEQVLTACNAFVKPADAERTGALLRLPTQI